MHYYATVLRCAERGGAWVVGTAAAANGWRGKPAVGDQLEGRAECQLELSTVAADGQHRVLQTRTLQPGMVLEAVALAAGDQTLLAVLRDAQGRELARAESSAKPSGSLLGADAPVDAGHATVSPSVPRAKGIAPDWKATFAGNDAPNGTVWATTIYDDGTGPALVIGGQFTAVGGVLANNVARWNGNAWSALGSGAGNGVGGNFFSNSVQALAASGSDLYVGGFFSRANVGGSLLVANNIARWNGSAWSALGSGGGNGVNIQVNALAASGSDLYVGGFITEVNVGSATVVAANHIARWNGSAWSTLGTGIGNGVSGDVNALAVSGSDLYVGGAFTTANVGGTEVAANRIARWDGSAWSALGSGGGNGVDSYVFAIAVSGSDLYVGGLFSQANVGGASVVASNIARWNGTAWTALGNSGGNGVNDEVYAIAASGSDLYVAGGFTQANVGGTLVAVNNIARWTGSAWTTLGNSGGNGVDNVVRALAVSGSDLYVGGQELTQANVGSVVSVTNNIARWNGNKWSALGSGGLNGSVDAMMIYDDGTGPALVIGGSFTTVGDVLANRIARWNGNAWSALGSGGGNGVDSDVQALSAVGSDLYVGGLFTQVNVGGPEVAANYVARWDGSGWSALGSGGGNGVNSRVFALAGSGSDLYVGGQFAEANVGGPEVAAFGIAHWNGSAWSALGSGGGNGVGNRVFALAVSGSDLYVGGDFAEANVGGTAVAAFRIARWNGSAWSALGSGDGNGVGGPVRALAVSGSDLYVGGVFTEVNVGSASVPANYVARWNGSTWSKLGSGSGNGVEAGVPGFGRVSSLLVSGGDLYAGGFFSQANAGGTVVAANGIARWNGNTWSALGSGGINGVDNSVRALAVSGSDLYVGGDFIRLIWGGTTLAANRLIAYGLTDSSSTEVTSTHPTPSRAGEPVRIRARVVASTAPTVGHVNIAGAAGGSCSDLTLVPISATASEAECTIRWNTSGARMVTASYVGGAKGANSWQPSTSAPYLHTVDPATDGWRPMVGLNGLNGSVSAATLWDDGSGPALVVAGDFTLADGVLVNRIARWNGSAWTVLGSGAGSGLNNVVRALEVSGATLYVGGDFTEANVGGTVVAANRVARWNGRAWTGLGSGAGNGVDGAVNALGIFDSALYVGGSFTQANVGAGLTANRIARWNGSAWSAVGSGIGNGLNNVVRALDASGASLYVGGDFTEANVGATVAANRIARWNGSAWSALGSAGGNGVNNSVHAIAASGVDLYVGGDFTQANVSGGVVTANRLARWNGSAWSRLGSGLGNGVNDTVRALMVSDNQLYIGGQFTQANVGGMMSSANRIARWNGSAWSALSSGAGNGVDNTVFALARSGLELYLGGQFTQANLGGTVVPANFIAAWGGTTATTTVVLLTSPNPSALNQPVTLTAGVFGRVAPTPGSVTFVGVPTGSCVDTSLTVLDDFVSEASCTISFTTAGAQSVTASYSGASQLGSFGHLSSVSAAVSQVVADSLFANGFETTNVSIIVPMHKE